MANFIVVSPSKSNTADASGDLFVYRSGAVSGATLIGGTGNDTVQLLDGGNAGSGASFNTKGGADVLQFSAATLSAKFIAGAGGDSVFFSGANTVADFGLGKGSDNVQIKGVLTVDAGSIKGAGGADLLSGDSDMAASGASILLGAGKDTITLTASNTQSALIVGGGGADRLTLNASAGAADFTIKGGAGGDVVTLSAIFDSGAVLAGNGSDTVNINGDFSKTGSVLGGKGADFITLSGSTFTDFSGGVIGGGAGADTLTVLEFGSAGAGAEVLGGGGNDSISLTSNDQGAAVSAGGAAFSAGATFGTIAGGAGADSITFTGAHTDSAGIAAVIAFSAISDSTLASQDVITYERGGDQGGFLLDFGGTIGTAIGSGQSNTKTNIGTNGAGFLASAGTNSSIAERASAMDTLLATGQIGTFTDASGSAAYLFVQGGATDLVAKFTATNESAGTVALSATGGAGSFKITFD